VAAHAAAEATAASALTFDAERRALYAEIAGMHASSHSGAEEMRKIHETEQLALHAEIAGLHASSHSGAEEMRKMHETEQEKMKEHAAHLQRQLEAESKKMHDMLKEHKMNVSKAAQDSADFKRMREAEIEGIEAQQAEIDEMRKAFIKLEKDLKDREQTVYEELEHWRMRLAEREQDMRDHGQEPPPDRYAGGDPQGPPLSFGGRLAENAKKAAGGAATLMLGGAGVQAAAGPGALGAIALGLTGGAAVLGVGALGVGLHWVYKNKTGWNKTIREDLAEQLRLRGVELPDGWDDVRQKDKYLSVKKLADIMKARSDYNK
jgi:hypothetical protein